MNASTIKARFDFYIGVNAYPPSVSARGVYVGKLNVACGGDANRKLVLKYLTGETSTKKLTDAQWGALRKMCDISPDELERFCRIILGEVVRQVGQVEMEL